jgi:hypothetical protein
MVDLWLLVAFGSAAAVERRDTRHAGSAGGGTGDLHGRPIQAADIEDARPDGPVLLTSPGTKIAIE